MSKSLPKTHEQEHILHILNLGQSSIVVQQQQVDELRRLQDGGSVLVGDMSGNDWLDLMWNRGYPLLFTGYIDEENLCTDQINRAEYLVNEMQKRGLKKLRTMDGHGRFLTCFLMALRKAGQDVDTYEIEIYDKDPVANAWHKMFFPNNVVVAEENILEDYDGLDDTMMYLNFCSIGGQVDSLDEYLQMVFNHKDNINIMLSFSTRGVTRKGEVGSFIVKLPQKYEWNYYCHRGNFFSGIVSGLADRYTSVSKKCKFINTLPNVDSSDDEQSEINDKIMYQRKKIRRIITDD